MDKEKLNQGKNPSGDQRPQPSTEGRSNKGFSADKPKPDLPRMESKPPAGPKK
jgi:hypothetical protein